jgi:hypothetical protein
MIAVSIPVQNDPGPPVIVLAPLMFNQDTARDTVDEVIREMQPGFNLEQLQRALGRRGFVWPTVVQAQEVL